MVSLALVTPTALAGVRAFIGRTGCVGTQQQTAQRECGGASQDTSEKLATCNHPLFARIRIAG